MRNIYKSMGDVGLSFVDNNFELPSQNFDALMQLNQAYQEKWATNKSQIRGTSSFLDNSLNKDINGSNKVHLQNAKSEFEDSIKDYVDNGNFEHASKSVDIALNRLTNDKAFNDSIKDYDTYMAWASEIKNEQDALLKNGKASWTSEEQAAFRNYYRQNYKGVTKNDDGTVNSGFYGGSMGEKLDIMTLVNDWSKDVEKEVKSKYVTLGGNEFTTVAGVEKVTADSSRLIYDLAIKRASQDPKVKKFFETQNIINSQKDIKTLASEVMSSGGSMGYADMYNNKVAELSKAAKIDDTGHFKTRLKDFKNKFPNANIYGVANAVEDVFAGNGIDIKFNSEREFNDFFIQGKAILDGYNQTDNKEAYLKLYGEDINKAMILKSTLSQLSANNTITNAALQAAKHYGAGKEELTSITHYTDEMGLFLAKKAITDNDDAFASATPTKVDIANSFQDSHDVFNKQLISSVNGFRTANNAVMAAKLDLIKDGYQFDRHGNFIKNQNGEVIRQVGGKTLPALNENVQRYTDLMATRAASKAQYDYFNRHKMNLQYETDKLIGSKDVAKYNEYLLDNAMSILTGAVSNKQKVANSLKQDPYAIKGSREYYSPNQTDIDKYKNKIKELINSGKINSDNMNQYINSVWKSMGNKEDLKLGAKYKNKYEYFSNKFEPVYKDYAKRNFTASFATQEMAFNLTPNDEDSQKYPKHAVIRGINNYLQNYDLADATIIGNDNKQYFGRDGKEGMLEGLHASNFKRMEAYAYGYDPVRKQNYIVVHALDADGKIMKSKKNNDFDASFRVYSNAFKSHIDNLNDVLLKSKNSENVEFAKISKLSNILNRYVNLDAVSNAYTGYAKVPLMDKNGNTLCYINRNPSVLTQNDPAGTSAFLRLEDAKGNTISTSENYGGLLESIYTNIVKSKK